MFFIQLQPEVCGHCCAPLATFKKGESILHLCGQTTMSHAATKEGLKIFAENGKGNFKFQGRRKLIYREFNS